MSIIQVTVRSIPDSPTIEYRINKYFEKIRKLYPKIINCRVVIDVVQKHKHKGKIFSVNADLIIPGKELVSRKQNQNLFVAIREGFSAIEKSLKKHCKRKITSMDKNSISNKLAEIMQSNPTIVGAT